jgi:hypothetical protein
VDRVFFGAKKYGPRNDTNQHQQDPSISLQCVTHAIGGDHEMGVSDQIDLLLDLFQRDETVSLSHEYR